MNMILNINFIKFYDTYIQVLLGKMVLKKINEDWINKFQGSPNQAKWMTSSPWFQWSHPISVKKRSFSRPCQSFQVRIFFTYRVWCSIFYSKLINCILLRSLFVFVKGRGTCGSGERNVKIWIDFRKSPRFSLTSP